MSENSGKWKVYLADGNDTTINMLPPTYKKQTEQYEFKQFYYTSNPNCRRFTVVVDREYDDTHPTPKKYEFYPM